MHLSETVGHDSETVARDSTRSIVLIHAVRSSRTMWKGQTRRLRPRGYTVIAPDLPGHGRRRGEPFTLEGALATIDEAVDACAEPPLLVGLSLGGFLTLHWAGTHPGRLTGAVAADCTIVPGPALARIYGLWISMKDWIPGTPTHGSHEPSRAATARRRRGATTAEGAPTAWSGAWCAPSARSTCWPTSPRSTCP